MSEHVTMRRTALYEQITELQEWHDALVQQLREIKRQQLSLMQRAARIKLQIAQRGLAALQRD